jgi:glycosyltransferase involved in cell wall biosynthesis
VKLLLDCIVTSPQPSKCSTSIIYKTMVERILAERDDVFVYWLIPDWISEEEMKWYPDDARIQYMPIAQTKDRVREYLTLPRELYDALTFYGPCWDFDVLITGRAGLVPQMRLLMNGPRVANKFWVKEVWLIDVMPCLSYKETVPQMAAGIHDRWTLAGYQAADRVWNVSYYEPEKAKLLARKLLPPSQAIDVSKKLRPAVTAQFDNFELKAKKFRFKPGQTFGLSFIGRMEKANGIEDIADILEKAWILRGDKVKQIVCTVSQVVKRFDEEIVDVRFPPREEFWRICREELHAFVVMERSGAISLSVLEPLMLGVPVITMRNEKMVSLLGADYPFFADGPATLYGVFKALYDDYEASYEKFAKWHVEKFQPLWKARFEADLIYPQLVDACAAYEDKLVARSDELIALRDNETVQLIAQNHAPGETIYETVRKIGSGLMGVMVKKTRYEDHSARNLTFMSNWNSYRLGLKLFHGFRDGGLGLGHIEKVGS